VLDHQAGQLADQPGDDGGLLRQGDAELVAAREGDEQSRGALPGLGGADGQGQGMKRWNRTASFDEK
jgi:hypothetical protein